MKEHKFKESSDAFGKYHRVIYCEKCGVVAWDFNDLTTKELNKLVKECF